MKGFWNRIWPHIAPGIRLKLAVFTLFFVSALIAASFTYSYFSQKAELSRAFAEQSKAPEKLVSLHVTDLHRFTEALVQLETFRVRLKRKTLEAQKFKKAVLVKEKSAGNLFKGLLNAFGASVKYSYETRRYDTYYSGYLTEKNLRDFEAQLKTAFDAVLPLPLDKKTFDRFKDRAARVVRSQSTFNDAISAANEKDSSEKFRRLQENYERDRAILTGDIARLLDPLLQARLDSMQFSRQSIRLLSYGDIESRFRSIERQKDGSFTKTCRDATLPKKPLLDTAPQGTAVATEDWALLRSRAFLDFTKHVFCDTENYFARQDDRGVEVRLENSLYGVDFAVVPRLPAVVDRTERILRAEKLYPEVLAAFKDKDEKFAAELATLAAKKRERLDFLREKGIPPYKDKDFMNFAQQYRALQAQRDTELADALRYAEREKSHFAALKKRIEILEAQLKKGRQQIKENEQLLAKVKSGKAGKDAPSAEELEARIESERQADERLQAQIAQLKSYSGSLEAAPGASREEQRLVAELQLVEALLHLRDIALYGRVRLALNSEQQLLLRERRDATVRQALQKNYAAVRQFIHDARSETELPLLPGRVSPIAGGVLAVTRSEAEETMHDWDSTPLLGDNGLVRILHNENIAGYNMIVVDKTEGLERIKNSTRRLLYFSSGIAFLAIIAAWYFSGLAVRRIASLSATSEKVRGGDLQVVFADKGHDELASLGKSLNSMVEGLREREELRGELMAAEEIQKRLLPTSVPANLKGRAEIDGFYKAMVGIGGDYFDYVPIGADHVAIAMGDVSNHGVGPALVMAMTRSQLHAELRGKEISVRNILLKLNEQLYAETPPNIFVTFFLALYNLKTGEMQYASAGHSKPLLYRAAEKKALYLEAGGMPLGMDDNDFFAETVELRKLKLEAGDVFLQYTDGLSEAMNREREQFGYERMQAELARLAGQPVREILRALAQAVEQFTGTRLDQPGPSELNDDIALVCLRRTEARR